MWAYAQWTMERMCGIWCAMVMQRSNAARNLSLNILHMQQLSMLEYALCIDRRGRTTDAKGRSFGSFPESIATGGDISAIAAWQEIRNDHFQNQSDVEDLIESRALTNQDTGVALHMRARSNLVIPAVEVVELCWHLRQFEGVNPTSLPSNNTPYKANIWKRCKLNLNNVEGALAKSYIRSARYEDPAGRDSTYVRYIRRRIVNRRDRARSVGHDTRSVFGRIQYFLSYDNNEDPEAPILLAMVKEIPTYYTTVGSSSVSGLPSKLHWINHRHIPNATDKYFIACTDILSLQAIVMMGNDMYFSERDSCFYI